jgi:hypothetical protein
MYTNHTHILYIYICFFCVNLSHVCLHQWGLSGPTIFAQIINAAAALAQSNAPDPRTAHIDDVGDCKKLHNLIYIDLFLFVL